MIGLESLLIAVAPVAVGGPPVLVEPGRVWTYEASVVVGGPPVLVEPGRAWVYEASVSLGGPPVLVEPGRAWTYEASLSVGGPPVLVEPGRAWTYEATVAVGGPPVLVEPGRSWTYEASVSVGGPPVLVEPGRSWTYEATVGVGGPPVLVEPGRAWTYEAKVGGPPVLVEPGRAWSYEGKAAAAAPLRVRYVVLPPEGESAEVNVLRRIEPAVGAAKAGDGECPKAKASCASKADLALLHLRSDYVQKGIEAVGKAGAARPSLFDFAPIPPSYAKVLVGSRREDGVKIATPSHRFAPGRVWTASHSEDGSVLEVVCTAKALPAAAEDGSNARLENFREVYRIDALTGVTQSFERTLRVREGDSDPQDVTVRLNLVDWKDLSDDEVKAETAVLAR